MVRQYANGYRVPTWRWIQLAREVNHLDENRARQTKLRRDWAGTD